ncbi:hypothetical protein ACE41H_18625 [Paenibacillus enshidis]|uniref:Uncharacterized protein n=1 Tax=Paenibacillus enshidis TaxID=1458439 RepID=A0ABV5AXS3_9BACL
MSEQISHLLYIIFLSILALGSIGLIGWWMISIGRKEKDRG